MSLPTAARPLRFRLFLLAASGLLPLALVTIAMLSYLVQERERDAEQAALTVSRAIGTAVEAELRAAAGVLQSIALSDELRTGRLTDFHALANRVAGQQDWRGVLLADAKGTPLLNSSRPAVEAPARIVDTESMQRALTTRQPVVGRVAEGQYGRGPAFALRVPVLRDGRLDHVLTAVIPVEKILVVIQRQKMPTASVVGVFDHTGNRVARSVPNSNPRPSASLQKLLDTGAEEGSGPTTTLEGTRSHTGYTRLASTGWVVATAVSAIDADRGAIGVYGAIVAGLLSSLALSAFLAWYFARGVTGPIDVLKAAAGALGRGEPVKVPELDIAELQDVGVALERASADRDSAALERKAAEAEREMLLTRATEALRSAEDAGRSKDEFLAMLGHELRNPLAPMATALHLMARKGDDRTRQEREVMERQVSHMKRLVDDLLDVSRITGKRLVMRMEPLRLAELVRHGAQAVQPVLGERRFTLDIPPDAEALWVSGDEVRLGQVFSNLLGNAVKFSPPDGAIILRLRREGDAAEVTVEDDGVGMSAEVLQHVFDLFYQAPQGADRSRGGLGLGLAIVRSLVEMHGGMVRAASDGPGRGSHVAVRLPLAAPPQESEAPGAHAPELDRRGRVLVVDDNQDAADTASALLEISGYEVQVAYTPEAGLKLLAAFAPQVALLDIGLPGMSGYELAERVRAHPNGAGCHLIALTGYGTQADAAKALQTGFDRHLVKPAGPETLLQAVEQGMQGQA